MHSLGETVGQEKWLLAGVVIRRFWTTGLVPCPSLCPDSSNHRVLQRRRQGQGPCRSRRQPTVPGTLRCRKAASQSTSCLQPGNHRIRKQREGIEDRTQQVCPSFQNKLFSFAARAHLHHNPHYNTVEPGMKPCTYTFLHTFHGHRPLSTIHGAKKGGSGLPELRMPPPPIRLQTRAELPSSIAPADTKARFSSSI